MDTQHFVWCNILNMNMKALIRFHMIIIIREEQWRERHDFGSFATSGLGQLDIIE